MKIVNLPRTVITLPSRLVTEGWWLAVRPPRRELPRATSAPAPLPPAARRRRSTAPRG